MAPGDRHAVLALGRVELPSNSFTNRRLNLITASIVDVITPAAGARAVVIAEPIGTAAAFSDFLRDGAASALNHGLYIAFLVSSDADFLIAQSLLKGSTYERDINLTFVSKVDEVAESIARADDHVGPSLGNVSIDENGASLDSEQKLLLGRAFSDCERVRLEVLTGGKASDFTFCVHVWLERSDVGPRLLPFFVKIADRDTIRNEVKNYADYADFYIPFNLRPNLVKSRLVRGSTRAALVGNFVDGAVPLRAALRSGQGAAALFFLFEGSLKGLRMQPFVSRNPFDGPIGDFVAARTYLSVLDPAVILLANELGLTATPTDLEAKLIAKANTITSRWGPYHGDLHAGNVMVRNRDAILIDFGSVGRGPLTADPATLEASLVFGCDQTDANMDFDAWRAIVDHIYRDLPVLRAPIPEKNPGPLSWLNQAVRELRHVLLCCECDPAEPKVVLAAYILRMARLPIEVTKTDEAAAAAQRRHAYALVIAQRIITSL